MLEGGLGHRNLVIAGVRPLISHLEDLTTAHFAHVHHQLVGTGQEVLVRTSPLLFAMAAIVVHDFLPVQVHERALQNECDVARADFVRLLRRH